MICTVDTGVLVCCLQTLVKSFEITELPVRAAKFCARKQWLLTGSDDMCIRVFNYNTMDKIKTFEAHTDYIRQVARSEHGAVVLRKKAKANYGRGRAQIC